MKTFRKLSIFLSFFYCSSLYSQSYNLHWGSTSWVGPTYTKTISNVGGSGINATVAITNSSPAGNVSAAGAAANNNAFQYNAPIVGAANVAWFLPGSTGNNPLVEYVDWNSLTSTISTVITFSTPVTNISFYVGDMDRTNPLSYVDRFTFTGKNGVATAPNPIITKFQATQTGPDTVLINANTAYGNAALSGGNAATSSVTTQGATVYVQFSNPITELDILWDEGPGAIGDPAPQAVAIGDISFYKVNQQYPPTASNFLNKPIAQSSGAIAIPGLIASDLDGTISNYKITSLPLASQGVLSISCPSTPAGATCTGGFANLTPAVLAANPGGIVLTPAQASSLRFQPVSNFIGRAVFNFNATDNDGNVSNTAAYALPVISQPPISNNIMENSMPNTNGPTPIQALNSSDIDGTISTYQITSLPSTSQGMISVPCPPTLTGATCTSGFQNLTPAILSGYPSGIPLTPTQISGMRFDPVAGYTGTATFTYNAIDNSTNLSNTANYTIPIVSTATTARPPLADNIISQSINSNLSNTSIPRLQANDLDGTIANFIISTVPTLSQGTLRISCPGTPSGLTCIGGYADILPNTILTVGEAGRLYIDPAPNFTGNASFTYSAIDNSGLSSNVGSYILPIVNKPPVSLNVNTNVPFNAGATVIPFLSASDDDGTITNYTITSVPATSQGTISIPCPPTPTGGTCSAGYVALTPTVLTSNPGGIVLTAAQAAGIKFTPTTGFSGTSSYNYTSTDNSGNVSEPAIYNIAVVKQPPVSVDIINASMPNTNGATSITSLSATDADGTIAGFYILSLPDAAQGVITIPCPATPTGATCTGGFANLTAAVLNANTNGIQLTPAQAASLQFNPAAGFTGLAAFKYTATDNSGLYSNISTYTIPVSGSGNLPPLAKNITATALANTSGVTSITTLIGSDPDGSIASYTLYSVPSATQGVLSIPCPATPTGAACSAGYTDLTPAVLAANTNGIVLTPLQAASMRFDPAPNFSGNVEFSYTTTDNVGASSAGVIYTIPVTNLPPVANAVIAPEVSQNNGITSIPGLQATDADGSIATYYIESLPASSQGTISIPCPVILTGASCVSGFQDLTAAVLSNYTSGGIPLTPIQMAGMRFNPASGYFGSVVFNYHAIDNTGLISNSATYTIPVSNLSPLSNDILSAKMVNSNGATAISSLSSTDPDGTINNYVINSLPLASQGILSIPCPATPAGATCSGGFANLTSAVLTSNPGGISLTPAQMAGLRFDPDPSFSGNSTFNYSAYDNVGNVSNLATYTIPVDQFNTLPLSILNFSGERNGNNVLLYWKSENEININKYNVEYGTNNMDFSDAGSLTAKNQAANSYHFTALNFVQPVYYFRLKSIDNNGLIKYSAIVMIKMDGSYKKALHINPNPVTDKILVHITSDIAATCSIKIINNLGQVLYKTSSLVIKGENLIPIQRIPTFIKGVYLIQASLDGEMLSEKILMN